MRPKTLAWVAAAVLAPATAVLTISVAYLAQLWLEEKLQEALIYPEDPDTIDYRDWKYGP